MKKSNLRRPMRRRAAFILMFFIVGLAGTGTTVGPFNTANAAGLKDIAGLWRTHKGELIHFYPCGRQICGRIIKARTGLHRDINNPNPKLRKRPVKGLTVIRSRKKAGPQKWVGTVYNVEDGKTYAGSLKLVSRQQAKLTGCIPGGFCQSALWRKVGR